MRVSVRSVAGLGRVSVVDDVASSLHDALSIRDIRTSIMWHRHPCVAPKVNRLQLISRPCGIPGALVYRSVAANLVKAHAATDLVERRIAV